jgi:hypothetical protein
LVSRTAADKLLLRMEEDGQIERIKRGLYGLPGDMDAAIGKMREKREKGRLETKPLKEQGDNGQSPNLPHLPEDVESERSSPRSRP